MRLLATGSLDPQGPVAAEIAQLWWVMLTLGVAVFVVCAVLLALGLFRRQRPESGRLDSVLEGRWIVGGGVVLPATIVAVVFGFTLAAMRPLAAEPPLDALAVEVVGHQWWWEISYPGPGLTTANEIHIPVGRPIELRLRSADVIHSFWVPSLGGKLDLLPDTTNTLVLQADEPGEYRGVCAEFCGLQHANMGLVVVAVSTDEFDAWVEGQLEAAADPAGAAGVRGAEVFSQAGCAGCHTIRGTRAGGEAGPDLTHLASRLTLAAATLTNTPEHLATWVGTPQTVKKGTQMPDPEISDADLQALLIYLEGLK